MLGRKTLFTLVAALAIATSMLAASTTSAAEKNPCGRPHFKLVQRVGVAEWHQQHVRSTKTSKAYFLNYVCSRAFGRTVFLGRSGVNREISSFHHFAAFESYAGIAQFAAGGGGENTSYVLLIDLANARITSRRKPFLDAAATLPATVVRLVVGTSGHAAWTTIPTGGGGAPGVWRSTGGEDQLLYRDNGLDPGYLKSTGSQLVYSPAKPAFDLRFPAATAVSPRRASKCKKPGDHLVDRRDGNVMYERDILSHGSTIGTSLIGCSDRTNRRFSIGRFGLIGGIAYSLTQPIVGDGYAAYALRTEDAAGATSLTVKLFNLNTGEQVFSEPAGFALKSPVLTKFLMLQNGTLAWIAKSSPVEGSTYAEVRVRDDAGIHSVGAGNMIDPNYLTVFDGNRLTWSGLQWYASY